MGKIDEFLVDRIRNVLQDKQINWEEKRMFGGLCIMVNDKMCFGTFREGMMARIAPEEMETLTQKKGVEQMVMGERPMKGYVSLDPEAYDTDDALEFWIQKCLDFNPRAKASKKKKKKKG